MEEIHAFVYQYLGKNFSKKIRLSNCNTSIDTSLFGREVEPAPHCAHLPGCRGAAAASPPALEQRQHRSELWSPLSELLVHLEKAGTGSYSTELV